jgi:hypothetical protein
MNNKLFLTESEKSRISGLHRKAIVTESKNILNEATLADIQNLLKDKGLDLGPKGVDGKIGPFTLNAIYSVLQQSKGTPTGTTGTSGSAGIAGTSGSPASPTTGTPTSTTNPTPLSGSRTTPILTRHRKTGRRCVPKRIRSRLITT